MRPIVIALVDTGINPYHEVFSAGPGMDAEASAARFGAHVVALSREGGWPDRVEQDEDVWGGLEPGRLYAFAGTRVFGISLSQSTSGPALLDEVGHGTETASVAASQSPGSFLVMIQVDTALCPTSPGCVPMAAAMEWAASRPWIDVISVSVGYAGNFPFTSATSDDVAPYLTASRKAYESGKILVSAAGNTFAPPHTSYLAGPPWVIAVGGSQPSAGGEAVWTAKTSDVVANYTQALARADSLDEMKWNSGTSYAAPLVAACLAEALRLVREAEGGAAYSPHALRQAMNLTAVHFRPTDWKPTELPGDTWREKLPGMHVPVVLAPLQMGWGHVEARMAPEIARRVLEDDLAVPPEKSQTAAYMAQWQALREAYWGRMA